jgi:hypothetical protein
MRNDLCDGLYDSLREKNSSMQLVEQMRRTYYAIFHCMKDEETLVLSNLKSTIADFIPRS